MPFKMELDVVYSDHIKKVAHKLNLRCKRADDIFSNGVIIENIWEYINRAQIVIADLTGKNPNVFYEVGMAHVLGKPVVLVTQSIEDVPFDLRHIRNIVYEYTPRGMQKFEASLQNTLQFILEQPKTSMEQFKHYLVSDTFPKSDFLDGYTDDFIKEFVIDRINNTSLRARALELIFLRGSIEQSLLDVLNREQNNNLRKQIAKLIKKYSYSVSKQLLVSLLEGERTVALAAVKAAYSFVKSGQYSSDIFRYVNAHTSWEVQRNAVECTIELDDKDSLNTLLGFHKINYHLTVLYIIRYIELLMSEGRMTESYIPFVIAFLRRYASENRFSSSIKENIAKTLDAIQKRSSAKPEDY